jgi:molecular chaperone DnaK (HSP70)
VDPMTAIAEGAAIAEGILQGTITDLDFHVGTEHALGTVVHNDDSPPEGSFSVLIGRNTKYPARATDSYQPAVDFQEQVKLVVIEGDPDKPISHEDNVILKDWVVPLPEKRLQSDAAFDVVYDYDVDGILHVTVRDERSGATMMAEELSFGAAQDRSQLPTLRRTVDNLMAGQGGGNGNAGPAAAPTLTLSPESVLAIRRARDKVLPFVGRADQQRLEQLTKALEESGPEEETACRAALEQELRVHAYLL